MEIDPKNFGAKISGELKDKIDEQLVNTKLPMGRAIEALAEFWVCMTEEEQKNLCYGVNEKSLVQFIDDRIALAVKVKIPPELSPDISSSIDLIKRATLDFENLAGDRKKEFRSLYKALEPIFKKTKRMSG